MDQPQRSCCFKKICGERGKIMKKYFVDKEDCEFKDILVENKGEQWISELYISATEYSITIVYKRGEKRKNV